MSTFIEEYWYLIKGRHIVVGYWVKQQVKNLIEDLQNPAYIYDTTEAHKRFKFQETLCLQSKAPYYMKPLTLFPWQKAWWEPIYSFKMADTGLRRFTEGLLEVARKNGKDMDENTRIPTPEGDRLLRDIKVGDYVFGADGKPAKVLGTRTFNDQICYEVTFEDGEKITCGEHHLWRVKDKNSERRFKRGTIDSLFYEIETRDLIHNYVHQKSDGKGKEYFYRVPMADAVEYPERNVLIEPYTLGAWLGDGAKNTSLITCGISDLRETMNHLEEDGYMVKSRKHEGKYVINVKYSENHTILPLLHKLGIYEKHIPEEYFYSSIHQRMELLKGLMDTDGTVSKTGECEWVQKSEKLTKDFSRLLSSLGIKHSIIPKNAFCNRKDCGTVYRVIFYVDKEHSCFKLLRKHSRLKGNLKSRMLTKSIINIERVPTVNTKCLSVEGGLFLCGERNTVTHNSTMFAGDANYDLFVGEGGMDICCASNDDRQARLIWSEIAGMRSRLDPKKAITSQNLIEIKNRIKNTTVFRLSSKTQNKDGFNISKVLLDESHDINEPNGQSEVAEACWRGMSSKEEPLFLNCSTQGFNRDCYLDKQIEYAKKVISGEVDDIHLIAFLYEQDSEQEIWQDKTSYEKSNPSLRYGVKKIAKLERDVEKAKTDKATRIHLLVKDFNIPQSTAESWLMLELYDYKTEAVNMDELKGAYILGAVDLSATTDLTSAKALIMLPYSNKKIVLSHYRIPESKLTNSPDKDAGAKYEEWAKAGLLTIDPGDEVNVSGVADWYYELYKKYRLKPYMIGYDERYAKTFIDRCEEYGFQTVKLYQGRALSGAMKLTEAEFRSKVINFQQNPIDKWCLGNCCCRPDNFGNIQPVKIPGEPHKRIDGALTFIMLNEVYRRYKDEYLKLVKGE